MIVELITNPLIMLALIAASVSYLYEKGLEQQERQTKLWQRELHALIKREQRREDEEDRKYKDKDNEE
jgi:predicted secreted protein